jgi:hypothetical protein
MDKPLEPSTRKTQKPENTPFESFELAQEGVFTNFYSDAVLEQPSQKPTEQPKLPLYLTAEFRPKPLPLHLEKFARAARMGKLPATLADTVVSHVGWWFVTSDARELEALEQLHNQHYGSVQA